MSLRFQTIGWEDDSDDHLLSREQLAVKLKMQQRLYEEIIEKKRHQLKNNPNDEELKALIQGLDDGPCLFFFLFQLFTAPLFQELEQKKDRELKKRHRILDEKRLENESN